MITEIQLNRLYLGDLKHQKKFKIGVKKREGPQQINTSF